jgi:hypothetical protein
VREIVKRGSEVDSLPIEAMPLYSMEIPGMMKQIVFRCPNSYGLSVVEGFANYCSARSNPNDHTTFEVALVHWAAGAADNEFEVVFAKGTPFEYDVQGWQNAEEIAGLLLVASRVAEHSKCVDRNWDDEEEGANV